MGSKGTSTATQNTSQTWAPSSEVMGAYRDLLSRAQGVADTPYQAYSGPMVAGFTDMQNQAFGQTQANQGVWRPYLDQAAGATASAMTPTYSNVGQYMSPYTQQVVDATRANMNQNNAIQQSQLLGNAAAKGALGGDRVGVMQAELARNQSLADNQTISGLYNQGYTTALGAAQTDAARSLNAGAQFNQLGSTAAGLGAADASNLYGMGLNQQQLNQAQLNVPYQQFLEQRAFPYQQAQWLAGLTTGVGSQMGGSSYGTGTSTSTPAQPNVWSQLLGAGLTAASMFADGGRVPYAEGGLAIPYGGGYVPAAALAAKPFQPPAPMQMGGGGGGQPQQQGGGASSIVNQALGLAGKIRNSMASRPTDISASGLVAAPSAVGDVGSAGVDPTAGLGAIYAHGGKVLDMERDPRGIYVPKGFADGGAPSFDDAWSGGGVDYGTGTSNPSFADRWSPVPAAISTGAFDPQGSNYTAGLAPAVSGAPGAGPALLPPPASAPAAIARAVRPPAAEPPDSGPMAYAPPDLSGRAPSGLNPTGGLGAAATPQAQSLIGRAFGLSPEANQAVMAAGLGMMASRSPWLGVAVGEGGQHGMQVYAEANKLREAAERAREQLAETGRHHREAEAQGRQRLDQENWSLAGTDEEGKPMIYDRRSGDWKTGDKKLMAKPGVGGRTGQTSEIIAELRRENPNLSYADALALVKRAPPDADKATLRREGLALQAAKADLGYMTNPDATIEKYRQKYGLGTAPAGGAPAAPAAAPSPAPSAPAKPAAPAAGAAPAPAAPAAGAGLKPAPADVLAKAKDAIAKGAPKDKVIERLKGAGFDAGGL